MAPLLTRKTVIKVKLEAVKGTKLTGDQAILAFDLEIKPTSPYEARKGSGLYLGHNNTGVLGERTGSCAFKTEFRANNSAGIEAGLAILFQGAGLVKSSETYAQHSSFASQNTISIDVWQDGVKFGLSGAMGTCKITGEIGKRVMCEFEFLGIWVAPVDEALPAFAPSTTIPMKLSGGVFTIGAASLQISKYELDLGNQVVMRPDPDGAAGALHFMITDYDPQISLDPEADLVATYDFNGIWLARTEAAVSLAIGDGIDDVTIATPKVQIKELALGDRDGIAMYDYVGQCNNNGATAAVTISVA
jgi:hypothetical protein